jgi:hypothetical protein
VAKKLVETFGVESNHHLIINDESGSGTAAIFVNQIVDGLLVAADVAFFECDTPIQEVGLNEAARRSTRLGKEDYFLVHVWREQVPVFEVVLLIRVLDFCRDFRGLLEHGGDRAILLFGKPNGVFDRLA